MVPFKAEGELPQSVMNIVWLKSGESETGEHTEVQSIRYLFRVQEAGACAEYACLCGAGNIRVGVQQASQQCRT
jgi:hypothetical protein